MVRGDTLELPRPNGVEQGDVLLARVAHRDDVSASMTSSGWAQVTTTQSAGLLKAWIFVKVAEVAEPEAYAFEATVPGPMAGSVSAFRGIDRDNPVDAASGQVNGKARALTSPPLRTTVGNDVAVWFGTQVFVGSSCPADTLVAPGGFRGTITTCATSPTSGLAVNVAYAQLGAAASQPGWTGRSRFPRTNIAQVVALRPAVPKQVADRYASRSVDVGTVRLRTTKELWEASGLATSQTQANVAYVHGEEDYPQLVAVDTTDASVLRRFTVPIPSQYDWEDIATGPCPAGSCIFAGDIGSSRSSGLRSTAFAIYRVPEPDVAHAPDGASLTGELFRFAYPDGVHNAEGLMVHPGTGQIYVVTKSRDGRSGVYAFPTPLPPPSPVTVTTLTKVATLKLPAWPGSPADRHAATWYAQVTAAAIHPFANRFLVRTPYRVYEFRGETGGSFESALTAEPTVLTAPTGERQGEAIDYAADGSAYFTLSEEPTPTYTLRRVDRR